MTALHANLFIPSERFYENLSFLVYSVALGTFSGSPFPGGEMEGDGAGCLSCMTSCNGSFFSSSPLFALERELGSGE